jgi:hypothetical protein
MIIKPRRISWEEHVPLMREVRNAYKILVDKSQGKSLFGRHRYRWTSTIKMYNGLINVQMPMGLT